MRLFLSLALLVATLSSCSKTTGPTLAPPPRGKPLFDFSPKQVTEIEIHQSRPEKGTSWSAGFKNEQGKWTIVSQTALEQTLVDTLADGNAINHFLDTLTTLTSTGTLDSDRETGAAPLLNRLGLDPPLAIVNWNVLTPATAGEPAKTTRYELHIGVPFLSKNQEGERFAKTNAYEGVFRLQGAALAMLSMFDRFETIRNRVLLTLPYDAIDTVKWQPYLDAERVGHDWATRNADPKNRKAAKLAPSFNDALEAVSRLRIKSFIDDSEKAGEIEKSIRAKPEFQLVFGDRHGSEISLCARTLEGLLFATESSRPGAVFELHPETKQHFAQLLISSKSGAIKRK